MEGMSLRAACIAAPSAAAAVDPGSMSAARVPQDVLAVVFCHISMGVRDRSAARLVCRHWRSAVDGLTVRRLALRSPGPGNCALLLPRRFPLLQVLSLGSAVTSSRAAFASALAALPMLGQLSRLSLEFASPAAVRLPSSLHALSRLQALSVSINAVQQGQGQAGAGAGAAVSATGGSDGGGGGGAGDYDEGIAPTRGYHGSEARSVATNGRGLYAHAAADGGGGGGWGSGGVSSASSAAAAALRIPPSGLVPLLAVLSRLTSLELVHLAASVPDVLAAVRAASRSAAAVRAAVVKGGGGGGGGGDSEDGGGGLRRLVLVGSGINLTGVGEPAAVAQLARLETLSVDSCTGADALVPLLPHLTRLRRLTLDGMDYAWAAAAGYHRRAGFDSSNDLQQHANHHNHQHNQNQNLHAGNGNAQPHNGHDNHHQHAGNGALANLFEMRGGGGGWLGGGAAAAAALAAAASGRPLAFLLCLSQLSSLSLSGSFLRTLPNRDIGSLTALSALDLSGNGIDDLPHGLASLPLLSRLDVSQNELVALPAWLAGMQSLESLSCHHNCIERFPSLLYDLSHLSSLAIGHNRISWWPVECALPRHRRPMAIDADRAAAAAASPSSTISTTSSCTTSVSTPSSPPLPIAFLDLSHNRLFGLPGGLAALGALRCLRLRDSLAGLDSSGTARAMALLAGLTALRELDLSSNHLDQHCIVPLSELRGLRQLWLADNGLEELPLGLAHLSCLTLLSLRANRFIELPVCLRWLSALEALDLSCNRLAELPPWIGGFSAQIQIQPPSPPAPAHEPHYNHHNHSHQLHPGGTNPGFHQPAPLPHQRQQQQQHGLLGLVGLRHLDVSQQYSVVVRESSIPHIPPRLEVQPPHCLYGPLQGDLPDELLRLPHLRTLVLQRHMLRVGSSVLRRLQARGVDIVHPRPLKVESLPGAAAAAFTTAAAAGGLLFPARHPELRGAAAAAAVAGFHGGSFRGGSAAAAAAASRLAAGRSPSFLGPRNSMLLLLMVVLLPLATASACAALGLPPPPHVVMLVVVAASTRLALFAVCRSRESDRRRQRQRAAAAAAATAAAVVGGGGGGGLGAGQ